MKVLLPILILLAGAGAFISVVAFKKPPEEVDVEVEPRLVEVTIAKVETTQFSIKTNGFVRARDRSSISAAISGPILETSGRLYPGEFFSAGEELLQIDPADSIAAIARAEAEVANEEALLAKELARSDMARRDWKALGRTGEPPPLVLLEPQLKQIRSSLAAAKADLKLAKTNLERSRVKAPFDALVVSKEAEVGHYVTPGSPLVTLLAIDFAEIRLPVSQEDSRFLELNQIADDDSPFEVEFFAHGKVHKGAIVRTENLIEDSTRSLYLVGRITDPYARKSTDSGSPRLAVGQFVEAALPSRSVPNLTRLPHQAMRGRDEVVIVRPDDTLEFKKVELIFESESSVFVRGLNDGDRVVLTSPSRALPGEKVEVSNSESEESVAPTT
ncbi:MAG: efflux RND transporter periplasmic adaptor subunit [Verrucomicrobiota bacterium]